MVQRMTMAWVKWLGCAGLLLLLSGPVMAAEGVLEILAAGDVLLGGRMLEAPQAGELFGPLTRRRLEQADIFLWNCEIAGLSSVSKQNTFVFHGLNYQKTGKELMSQDECCSPRWRLPMALPAPPTTMCSTGWKRARPI